MQGRVADIIRRRCTRQRARPTHESGRRPCAREMCAGASPYLDPTRGAPQRSRTPGRRSRSRRRTGRSDSCRRPSASAPGTLRGRRAVRRESGRLRPRYIALSVTPAPRAAPPLPRGRARRARGAPDVPDLAIVPRFLTRSSLVMPTPVSRISSVRFSLSTCARGAARRSRRRRTDRLDCQHPHSAPPLASSRWPGGCGAPGRKDGQGRMGPRARGAAAGHLDADLQVGRVAELALVGEREEAQLVQRVARVGYKLAQEDVLRARRPPWAPRPAAPAERAPVSPSRAPTQHSSVRSPSKAAGSRTFPARGASQHGNASRPLAAARGL